MILALWIVFAAVSALALVVGYWVKVPHYGFVALTFLFLLGGVILANKLEYPSGELSVTNYTYSGGNLSNTSTSTTTSYESFGGEYARLFGFLLCITTGFGLGVLFLEETKRRRARSDEGDDDES